MAGTTKQVPPDVVNCNHDIVLMSRTFIGKLTVKCEGCRRKKKWPWARMLKCHKCKVLWHRECVPTRIRRSQEEGSCCCSSSGLGADVLTPLRVGVQALSKCDNGNAEQIADPPQRGQTQATAAPSSDSAVPTYDPYIPHPDYDMTAYDHGSLLVLVKRLGEELSSTSFNRLFERISRIDRLRVVDGTTGAERCVRVRYVKDYPVGNNDWGDFQTHRRLLGLLTVSKCKLQIQLNETCRLHESLKVKYHWTLYDSQSIVFGVNAPNRPDFSTPTTNFKSKCVYYANDNDDNPSLETHINDFLSSLFWALDAKRLEKSKEKLDNATLLIAPIEERNTIGLDTKFRADKKRVGRAIKHLADLNLQTDLLHDAFNYYRIAINMLRPCNDWLWLGGSLEGLCATTSLMISQSENESTKSNFQRNASLQERHSRLKLSTRFGFPSLGDNVISSETSRNLLNIEDIYKMYAEALKHYEKNVNAGVILTEGRLKAARIAAVNHHYTHAYYFLQNILDINLPLTDEEKTQRLMKLAELYAEIGCNRKASFFKELAYECYASDASKPHTSWVQCYQFLLQMLPGHKLPLDPNDCEPGERVEWPELQRELCNEIVLASMRTGSASLATRRCTFLIQTMWWLMDKKDRSAKANQLSV